MRIFLRDAVLATAVLCLAAVAASAGLAGTKTGPDAKHGLRVHATRGTLPLRTALVDPYIFAGASSTAFAMAQAAGVTYVRLPLRWRAVAPATRPVGFVASDPSSPGYSWSFLDQTVAAAEAAGLTPILDVVSAPEWAFSLRPRGGKAGSPKPTALRQFATALAKHYDGDNGAPPVHVFEVWNEPNLSLALSPVKPARYRAMVNALADAVHAVNRRNLVVAGGLDPFGHKKTRRSAWYAQAPLAFMRSMLCVSMGNPKAKKAKLRRPHRTCKKPAEFDVWSHHPYTFNGPFGKASRRDDVSLGDLPEMRKLLQTAVRLRQVRSAHRVQFWVTEFSWDTRPPRRHAAPMPLAARWTSESLYQMWRSGVSLVTWFQLQDRPSPSPYQGGFYFHSKNLAKAKPKPTLTAFRFPFVAYLGARTVSIWGRDATSDKQLVAIQRAHRTRGPWRTVARIRSNRYGIFKASLKLRATKKDWLRAVAPGSGKSLAFSLRRPSSKLRYGPWGN